MKILVTITIFLYCSSIFSAEIIKSRDLEGKEIDLVRIAKTKNKEIDQKKIDEAMKVLKKYQKFKKEEKQYLKELMDED